MSVLKKFFFIFICFNFISCVQANSEVPLKIEQLLVLGVGGELGSEYKIEIFEKLRSSAKKIHVCELKTNPIIQQLLDRGLVDYFIPVDTLASDSVVKTVVQYLNNKEYQIDAVVTYREEWLEPRILIASKIGLPHPKLEAVHNSQRKDVMKRLLSNAGLVHNDYLLFERQNPPDAEEIKDLGYPLFAKPSRGIRSEWARWIFSENSLDEYIASLNKHAVDGPILLEKAISGQEVDVDMVLSKGHLVYSAVSDNFPVFEPYALETGHLMPSLLPNSQQERLVEYAYKAVQALGHDRGVFHVELIVNNDGIHMVEVNSRLGGMYIAKWHEEVWGVDLIKSELAISLGRSPEPYLRKAYSKSLAQLCVTTNTHNKASLNEDQPSSFTVYEWKNLDEFTQDSRVHCAKLWTALPTKKQCFLNGQPNIGEITVLGLTPYAALCKLYKVLESKTPEILTNFGLVRMSTFPLVQSYQRAVENENCPFAGANYSNPQIAIRGEWLFGQDIVKDIIVPSIPQVCIPKHFYIPLQDSNNFSIGKARPIYDYACSSNKAFSVKYSLGGKNAFTYKRKRGENSSRGRKIVPAELSWDDFCYHLELYKDKAPPDCSALVFQEFIDQSDGCLFHSELNKENCEVEILWENSTGRAYLSSSNSGEVEYAEIPGNGYPDDKPKACKEIAAISSKILNILTNRFGDITWSIEGFWNAKKQSYIVLQLRPTPGDRPKSKHRDIPEFLYSTVFTWGDYEIGPLQLTKDLASSNICIRQEPLSQTICSKVLERLNKNATTLLVDVHRGFVLSHEKWFLPPIHMRASYNYMYVPANVLNSLFGKYVKFISSDNKGYIVLYATCTK